MQHITLILSAWLATD